MTPINAATKRNNQESGLAGKRDPKKEQTPALVELKQKMRKRQLLAEKQRRKKATKATATIEEEQRDYEERTNEEPIHKQKEIAEKEKAEEPPPARRYQRSWAKPNYSRLNFMMA